MAEGVKTLVAACILSSRGICLLQVEVSGGCDQPIPPAAVIPDIQMRGQSDFAGRPQNEGVLACLRHSPRSLLSLPLFVTWCLEL